MIDEDYINNLVSDLLDTYSRLQELLREAYPDGKVQLQRRLNYNHLNWGNFSGDRSSYVRHFATCVLKARQEGLSKICLYTDTLSGWCKYDPGAYGRVLIKQSFNIEDVLLAQPFVSADLESDEWLVVNRSPYGYLEIDPNEVEIPNDLVEELMDKAERYSWGRLSQSHYHRLANGCIGHLPLGEDFKPGPHAWYVNVALRLENWLRHRSKRHKKTPRRAFE
ncbi:hypothetical protein [Chromohalobacter israelensis]|uniref:hypothetical protein n=1 Tax=Chromohalobacter israelensis TaxID=141390 RepID=UPI0012EB3549|nr:hypothetical protein [Chromohalobacter israelensis]MDF9434663.1 hypothetical protein [Chromohalobacter israelensis]